MKSLLIIISLLFVVSCSDDDNNDQGSEGVVYQDGDAVYVNGSTTLGVGLNSSPTAFIECRNGFGSLERFFPKKLLVAFGAGNFGPTTCGACTVSVNCTPGDLISINSEGRNGAIATPTDFNMAAGTTSLYENTCPQSGVFTEAIIDTVDYMKLTYQTGGVTDVEYLRCR